MRLRYLFLAFLLCAVFSLDAQSYVYKTTTIRAKPGKLLELIELIKKDMKEHEKYGMAKPYLMRHSQGDQWDLLLIMPVGPDMSTFFSQANVLKRKLSATQDQPYGSPYYNLVSLQEELYVNGPPLEEFNRRFETFNYYHVEMFVSLAGKQEELLKQRQMENVYLKEIGREDNLIFTKITGSEVDIFTLGFYRDIRHFAESADIPLDVEDKAAKKAGFEGVNFIGSYLRSLLLKHNDTLAGAVRPD